MSPMSVFKSATAALPLAFCNVVVFRSRRLAWRIWQAPAAADRPVQPVFAGGVDGAAAQSLGHQPSQQNGGKYHSGLEVRFPHIS